MSPGNACLEAPMEWPQVRLPFEAGDLHSLACFAPKEANHVKGQPLGLTGFEAAAKASRSCWGLLRS